MSEPIEVTKRFMHNAVNECISGMSALNMEARPVSEEEQKKIFDCQGYIFLSESDEWVKHAYEHFRAVCDNVRKAEQKKRQAYNALCKLLRSLPDEDRHGEVEDILTMINEI